MTFTQACGEYTKRGLMTREQYMRFHLNKQEVRKKYFWCWRGDSLLGSGVYGFDIDCKTTISEGLIGPRGSNTQNFNACFDTSG